MGLRLGCLLMPLLAAGCYVSPMDQQAPSPPTHVQTGPLGLAGSCEHNLGLGCFNGYVTAQTALHVDGKEFFDASTLGQQFASLLTVAQDGKTLTADAGGYKLSMSSPLNNDSFYDGVDYSLNGSTPHSGTLRADGTFSVDDLAPGSYALRLSKAVRFTLTAKTLANQPSPTSAPTPTPPTPTPPTPTTPATPTPTTPVVTAPVSPTTTTPVEAPLVSKEYCATLYLDSTVDVRADQATTLNFDTFRLHVTDDQCSAEGDNTTLTIGQ